MMQSGACIQLADDMLGGIAGVIRGRQADFHTKIPREVLARKLFSHERVPHYDFRGSMVA